MVVLILSSLFPLTSVSALELTGNNNSNTLSDWFYEKLANSVYSWFSYSAIAFAANRSYVEIGYNESVTFKIGQMDLTNLSYKKADLQAVMTSQSLTFNVSRYPTGSSNIDFRWQVSFDPPEVNFGDGTERKTVVTLSLSEPPVGEKAIQSGELVIRVNIHKAWGNLWNASKPRVTIRDFIDSPNGAVGEVIFKTVWFLNALFPQYDPVKEKWGFGWGTSSGNCSSGKKFITILVKVKPYHEAVMEQPNLELLHPNEVKSVPITITNYGNYKDTFGFSVETEKDGINISTPSYITLIAGETKETFIGIGAEPVLWDSGTIHQVKINVFSMNNTSKILTNKTLLVETQGVYVSELQLVFSIIMMVLIISIIFFSKRRTVVLNVKK